MQAPRAENRAASAEGSHEAPGQEKQGGNQNSSQNGQAGQSGGDQQSDAGQPQQTGGGGQQSSGNQIPSGRGSNRQSTGPGRPTGGGGLAGPEAEDDTGSSRALQPSVVKTSRISSTPKRPPICARVSQGSIGQGQAGPEAARRIEMGREDMQCFVDQWERFKKQAAAGDAEAKKKADDKMQSLGLRPARHGTQRWPNAGKQESHGWRIAPQRAPARLFRPMVRLPCAERPRRTRRNDECEMLNDK